MESMSIGWEHSIRTLPLPLIYSNPMQIGIDQDKTDLGKDALDIHTLHI